MPRVGSSKSLAKSKQNGISTQSGTNLIASRSGSHDSSINVSNQGSNRNDDERRQITFSPHDSSLPRIEIRKNDKGQQVIFLTEDQRCTFCAIHDRQICQMIISHRSIKCSACADRKAGATGCLQNLDVIKRLLPSNPFVIREDKRRTRFGPIQQSSSPNINPTSSSDEKTGKLLVISGRLNDIIDSAKFFDTNPDVIRRLERLEESLQECL